MISLLLLLTVANGAPVVAALLLKNRFNQPLDGGLRLPDGYPLFGPSKTVRGIAVALITSAFMAPFFNLSLITGALFGFWAMVGDLLSSFIKRRFNLAPSHHAPGLDHIPEAFLPLWFLRSYAEIKWPELAVTILAFVLLDLFLWHLLRLFHPRIHSR